jgi:hypothetical protein
MKTIPPLAFAFLAALVDERARLVTEESVVLIERCLSQSLARGANSLGGGWRPAADNNTKAAMLP